MSNQIRVSLVSVKKELNKPTQRKHIFVTNQFSVLRQVDRKPLSFRTRWKKMSLLLRPVLQKKDILIQFDFVGRL